MQLYYAATASPPLRRPPPAPLPPSPPSPPSTVDRQPSTVDRRLPTAAPDGTGRDGTELDGMGRDGTGRDGTGRNGTGQDGTGQQKHLCPSAVVPGDADYWDDLGRGRASTCATRSNVRRGAVTSTVVAVTVIASAVGRNWNDGFRFR